MNFGPLSRSGGYRRLNVAITRAKFNVKLVGSIESTDIDLEKTTSEGVKMLRSYMEFAKQGPVVLQNELVVPENINTDSPFEEAVYDFLIQKGYQVATQVGCSGYRIDLAVKHPSLSGRFVLGIECDGATYHSARTARERDRLRQTVLEDIGWKIYRIWSTDWIKDPNTESQKLLDAVKNAIETYGNDDYDMNSGSINGRSNGEDDKLLPIEVSVDLLPEEGQDEGSHPYDFAPYEVADIAKVKRRSNWNLYIADVIRYVVQKEYPIHLELLYKRVLGSPESKKMKTGEKGYILYNINGYLSEEMEIREGFVWPKGEGRAIARTSGTNGNGRKIEQISKEELAEGMYLITKKSFGIMQNDLFTVTARSFGFNRTGSNIVVALTSAFNYLLSTGKVKNVGGKVTV